MAIDLELIRRIEERSLNAWAAPRSMLIDGWIARFAYGYTKRANSVSVLYPGNRSIPEKIEICQQIYAQQNLPLIFRMSPLAPVELDQELAALGYHQLDFTSVQTKDLSQFDFVSIEHLQLSNYSQEWLDYFSIVYEDSLIRRDKIAELKAFQSYQALEEILASIVPNKRFAAIREGSKTIAVGLAVLEGKDVGLFEIGTRESYRRQGCARSIILGLLSWAKQQGATTAYLQVATDNQPALKLYEKLGFAELYQYFYRTQNRP